jgi:tight adherence protein C
MTILVLIALVLLGLSVVLALRAIAAPGGRASERIAQIGAYGGFAEHAPPSTPEEAERLGFVAAVGRAVAGRMDPERIAQTRSLLMGAGMFRTSPERYLGWRALSVAGFPLVCAYLAIAGGLPPAQTALFTAAGAFTGWLLPPAFVSRRARLRHEQIEHEMPELVDLLVVGVESGMGFAGAMRAACQRIQGPLGDELALMLREQSLGASMSDALRHMLRRCDTPSTRSFVRTITQGERLGVSIGSTMRTLAEEMRKRRKAHAEEIAHKAPVKLMFPLVFLIFPAMFIVLLGPAGIRISETFGS